MANPTVVAPGQPIASVWGNAVRSTVVNSYASLSAFLSAFPSPTEGQMFAVGGRPYIWRNGVPQLTQTYLAQQGAITGGNVAGMFQLNGVLDIYGPAASDACVEIYWLMECANHSSAGGTMQQRWLTEAQAPFVLGPTVGYQINEPFMVAFTCWTTIAANQRMTLIPWAFQQGQYGNTNVNGGFSVKMFARY